ncbi:hypothetical protein JYQ62_33430 [Nostoc sp. UHCC 0702]|nr:hypothetical protein JYQ62_33430 [Nostoc sp. UHCC 0702]
MKSLMKTFLGFLFTVIIAITGFQSTASAAPALNAFVGNWVAAVNPGTTVVTITEVNNIVTAKYINTDTGKQFRGPFTGFELDLYTPVINLNFNDSLYPNWSENTGVLSADGKTIYWTSGQHWVKK